MYRHFPQGFKSQVIRMIIFTYPKEWNSLEWCNNYDNKKFFLSLISDLKKNFEQPPYSISVELDKQTELRCLPPLGVPPPKVYWLRNGAVLEPDTNIIISTEGHLLISQARFQDTANYTCVAENIAAKRFSDSVVVKVVGKFEFVFFFSIICF